MGERQKTWYEKNKARVLQKRKEYAQQHKDEISEYKKVHYENNRELYKKRAAVNRRTQLAAAPLEFRQKERIRTQRWRENNKHVEAWRSVLRNCLVRMGKKKTAKTRDMLGYSPDDLKKHIENLWLEGMTWANYGEWHIDHFKPIISFDKDAPAHLVNALENLRPMWATTREVNGILHEGNLNKRDKWDVSRK